MNEVDFITLSSDEEAEQSGTAQISESQEKPRGSLQKTKFTELPCKIESCEVISLGEEPAVDLHGEVAEDGTMPKIVNVESYARFSREKETGGADTKKLESHYFLLDDFKDDSKGSDLSNFDETSKASNNQNIHAQSPLKDKLEKTPGSQYYSESATVSVSENTLKENGVTKSSDVSAKIPFGTPAKPNVPLAEPYFNSLKDADKLVKEGEQKKPQTKIKGPGKLPFTVSYNFGRFLKMFCSLEKREEDKVKLLKKLYKYHDLADPNYVTSSEFDKLLKDSMERLEKDSMSLYFVLKEILDNLLSRRVLVELKQEEKLGECSSRKNDARIKNSEDYAYFDANEKNYKKVKKLCSVLRKLQKRIRELEEVEVDLSDEEDSSYFKLQRFKDRFCRIYKKLCSYTGQPSDAKRVYSRKIGFSGTCYIKVNQAIEAWLNETKQFPDFPDVLKKVEKLNSSLSLGLSKDQTRILATEIFTQVGNSLQRRRRYDLWDSFSSYMDEKTDPAMSSQELQKLLDRNFELGNKKMQEVINYYAEKQVKDCLEPVAVPDDEADRSPVESGDEAETEIEQAENLLDSKMSAEVDQNLYESGEEDNCSDVASNSDSCDLSLALEKPKLGESTSGSVTECAVEGRQNCLDKPLAIVDVSVCEDAGEEQAAKEDDPARSSKTFKNQSISEKQKKSFKRPSGPSRLKAEKFCGAEEYRNLVKRLAEQKSAARTKRAKVAEQEKSDRDSDCEVVIILSEDEETCSKSETKAESPSRRIHQINYAFINSTFNYNAAQHTDDIFFRTRKVSSNLKLRNHKRKPFSQSSIEFGKNLDEFGTFGSVEEMEDEDKTKTHARLGKSKFTGVMRRRSFEKIRYRQKTFFPYLLPTYKNLTSKRRVSSETQSDLYGWTAVKDEVSDKENGGMDSETDACLWGRNSQCCNCNEDSLRRDGQSEYDHDIFGDENEEEGKGMECESVGDEAPAEEAATGGDSSDGNLKAQESVVVKEELTSDVADCEGYFVRGYAEERTAGKAKWNAEKEQQRDLAPHSVDGTCVERRSRERDLRESPVNDSGVSVEEPQLVEGMKSSTSRTQKPEAYPMKEESPETELSSFEKAPGTVEDQPSIAEHPADVGPSRDEGSSSSGQDCAMPRIVTVQGNVRNFESLPDASITHVIDE